MSSVSNRLARRAERRVLAGALLVSVAGARRRLDARAVDALGVEAGVLLGRREADETALELRFYITSHELVAVHDLFPRRPVDARDEQAAEAAALLVEALDLGDEVVRRADAPAVRLVHLLDDLVTLGLERLGEAHYGFKVVAPVGAGALSYLREGLLPRFGEVHLQDEAPLLTVHGLVVLRRGLLGDIPEVRQGCVAARARDREDAEAVLAAEDHAGRRPRRRDGDGKVGLRVGPQVEARVLQREPVALVRERRRVVEQAHDDAHRLVHARSLRVRLDAEHQRIRDERAGADAEHDAAARHVVEQHHAVRHMQRVVVGEGRHAGAELDVLRAVRRDADEDLGRADDLPAGTVVLADPRLVEVEVVEPLD